MIRRPRRSVPAVVVAALLLALCVLVVVAVAQSLLGDAPFLSLDQLLAVTAAQQWDSAATVAVAVVLAVLGLVLLVTALRPGNPTVLPLGRREAPDGRSGADAGVRRRSYDKDLTAVVSGIPGVVRAEVSAGRTAVSARVRVAATDPSVVPDRVRECLDARVLAIGPAVRPRVRVRARPAEKT